VLAGDFQPTLQTKDGIATFFRYVLKGRSIQNFFHFKLIANSSTIIIKIEAYQKNPKSVFEHFYSIFFKMQNLLIFPSSEKLPNISSCSEKCFNNE
jgi:hypothetical protein